MPLPQNDPLGRMRKALDKGGVSALETAILRAQKAAESAQKPFEKMAAALDDPRIRKAAAQILATEDATRKLNEQARERLSLEARRQSVASGAYANELRAAQLLTKEREKVEALERRAQFGARYGRFGGLMYAADALRRDPFVRGTMGVAKGIGGAATAGALQGFQGTVEWNRLNLELKMVSRELAGAFLPAIQVVTTALQFLRRKMESLTVRQQNLLMLGGLAFGGLAAAGLARMGLAGVMGGLGAGGAAAAGAAGGLLSRGRVAGMAGAGAAAAGIVTDNPFLAMGGGALMGARAGPIGAVLAALAAGAAAAPSDRAGERPTQYWTRMREERGMSMLGATLSMGNRSIARLFGASPDAAGGADGANPGRRRVTIADAGFDAPGSSYQRLTTALALTDANKDPRDVQQQILDFLKETFGGGAPARPAL